MAIKIDLTQKKLKDPIDLVNYYKKRRPLLFSNNPNNNL